MTPLHQNDLNKKYFCLASNFPILPQFSAFSLSNPPPTYWEKTKTNKK
jgi:hypothetical protein